MEFTLCRGVKIVFRLANSGGTGIYQFITNDDVSFHLWWKENLLNHQKSQSIIEIVAGD